MKDWKRLLIITNFKRIMIKNQRTKISASEIRKLSLQMVYNAKASHIGGALSMADILSVLYSDILDIDPAYPDNPYRDRFLLSKGHACTSFYATLALKGFFPIDDITSYSKNGSIYLAHPINFMRTTIQLLVHSRFFESIFFCCKLY